MKKRRVLWVSLAMLVLIPSVLFLIFVINPTGRAWLWERVETWLADKYHLSLQYDSLDIRSSAFGWRLTFRDLAWGSSDQDKRETIDELTLDVQPWGFLSGSRPISYAQIKGAHLSVRIDADRVAMDSAGYTFNADDLAKVLSKKTKSTEESLQGWPDLIVDDVHLDISNISEGEKQDFRLDLGGSWSLKEGLNRISAVSPGFDFVPLVRGIREFVRRSHLLPESFDGLDGIEIFERGRIEKLEVRCASLLSCEGSGWMQGLVWKSKDFIPGVNDLSGRIAFAEHAATLDLAASKLTMTWPKVYQHPIPLALQHTRISLNYDDLNLRIQVPNMALVWKGVKASAQARLLVPWKDPKKTRVNISLKSRGAPWPSIRGVLPDKIFSPNLNAWLEKRLQGGEVSDVTGKVSGEILKFPFASGKDGSFDLKAKVESIGVVYHDEWPRLDACKAAFSIDNAKLGISEIQCRADGITDLSGEFSLPELGAKNTELGVKLKVRSAYGPALSFLGRSPLRKITPVLASITQGAKSQETDVQMTVRLADEEKPIELVGHSSIEALRLLMPQSLYSGLVDRAEVDFDQDGLKKIEGVSASGNEKTKILLQKNAADNSLDLSLEPANTVPNPLKGQAKLRPANAPESLEGSLSGLKVSGDAALVTIDQILWNAGQKPLLAFKGLAQIKDFGAAVRIFNLPSEHGKGKGTIRFDLSMPGIPSDGIAKYLSGTVDIDLEEGQLKNLSRTITSLINFANLKVFGLKSDSLSYSFLKSRLKFANGTMITDESNIGLGVLEVEAVGTVDFTKNFMDMNLVIIPDLGSPVVAGGLALWNPLVGVALFGISIFQKKASDSRLNRAVSQTYKLKGKIDDPAISLIRPMDPMELLKF